MKKGHSLLCGHVHLCHREGDEKLQISAINVVLYVFVFCWFIVLFHQVRSPWYGPTCADASCFERIYITAKPYLNQRYYDATKEIMMDKISKT